MMRISAVRSCGPSRNRAPHGRQLRHDRDVVARDGERAVRRLQVLPVECPAAAVVMGSNNKPAIVRAVQRKGRRQRFHSSQRKRRCRAMQMAVLVAVAVVPVMVTAVVMTIMVMVAAVMMPVMIAVMMPIAAVVIAVGKSQRRSEQHERQQRGDNGPHGKSLMSIAKSRDRYLGACTDEAAVNGRFMLN